MILMDNTNVGKCPKIVVVGVGGAGCNSVDSMSEEGLLGVSYMVINTDLQALDLTKTPSRIHIGAALTNGRGTGGDPRIGEEAAMADQELIRAALNDAELAFIVTGLGGGTGTGAAPIVADIARDCKALTVAIATKPFAFEGSKRIRRAQLGQEELRNRVDTLITIPNERLVKIVDEDTTIQEAFKAANGVIMQCVQSIAEIITQPGMINRDFADIKAVMKGMGGAVMGIGFGKGENKVAEAFQQATTSSLLEEMVIEGARGILINITAGRDLQLLELSRAMEEFVVARADREADIVFGLVNDSTMEDEVKVTILANRVQVEEPNYEQNERVSATAGGDFDLPPIMPVEPDNDAAFINKYNVTEEKDYGAEKQDTFTFNGF